MNWRPAIANHAAAVFGLDLRSLAAMRIGLASVVLTDLAIRASDFGAMYTDAGIASVELVRRLQPPGGWSLHLLSGAAGYQAALFAVAAALGVALLLGYHTRLATIGSWILLTSLQVRVPLAVNAGDTLLRVMLFWAMFLPLGAVWSLDARRRGQPASLRVASAATVALMVQLAIVYWLAGWAKWNDAWLHGDALGDVFKFGLYGLPLGATLSDYPELTRLASRGVVWFELLGPLLLFIPWQTTRLRMIAIVGFVLMHVGIVVTMTVGLFSYAAIAAWLAIVPGEVWERFAWSRSRESKLNDEIPSPTHALKAGPIAAATFCWAALAVVIYWNVTMQMRPRPTGDFDRWMRRAAHATVLRQSWGVFGKPPRQDSWFVYQARLKNGEQIDLLSNGQRSVDEKPTLASRQFPNHRWRKYHWRLRNRDGEPYRQPLAEYICREWNAAHGDDEQVVRLDLYYYRQPYDFDGKAGDHVRETLAQVVLDQAGGNFAEAVRGGDNF